PAPEPTASPGRTEARRALGIAPEEAVFLFLGYVRAYKGVDVLFDALGRLSRDGPPWRALVAGEWYVDRRPLAAALGRAEAAGRVEIVDRYVSEEEVAELLAAADVV